MPPSEPAPGPRSIMVPVDGTRASENAVGLACDLAKKNKGKVYVVHVIEVKRNLPLDAPVESEEAAGDEILTQAERVCRDRDFDVESEILHAREASPAIVDEAIERGVDLIILGIEYQKPFGEFELPRVAQYVLKSAPCQVWLCRRAPES